MTTCLSKDETNYYVDGVIYPRVSTILESYFPLSPYLEQWRLSNPDVLQQAIDRGISVHKNIEDWAYTGQYDNKCKITKNLIENFYRYVHPIEMEKFLTYDVPNHSFAGTTDAIVNLPNNTFCYDLDLDEKCYLSNGVYLVDNKTKKSIPSECDFKNVFQLALYTMAYERISNVSVNGTIILYATKTTNAFYYYPNLWNKKYLNLKLESILKNYHANIKNADPQQFLNGLREHGLTASKIYYSPKNYAIL